MDVHEAEEGRVQLWLMSYMQFPVPFLIGPDLQ